MSQYTNDLIDQADTLLRLDKRRPKQANLRRAVSSAYYALFHFLIEESTALAVGTSNVSRPLRQLVGRGFSHTAMRNASAEMGKVTPTDLLKPLWSLYDVAASVELKTNKNLRHSPTGTPSSRLRLGRTLHQSRSRKTHWSSPRRL